MGGWAGGKGGVVEDVAVAVVVVTAAVVVVVVMVVVAVAAEATAVVEDVVSPLGAVDMALGESACGCGCNGGGLLWRRNPPMRSIERCPLVTDSPPVPPFPPLSPLPPRSPIPP